jgi:PAS domain S-box-containing protein
MVAAAAQLTLPDKQSPAPVSEITLGPHTRYRIETTAHAVIDLAGQRLGTVFVFHDVTESHRREQDLQLARDQLESTVAERTKALVGEIAQRAQTEEALAKSERRFRAIFDQSFQLVGLLDPDGTLLDANRSALALIGAQLAEVVGRPYWETPWWRHDPDEAAKLRKGLAAAAQGTFVRFETTHAAADGTTRIIDFSLKPILDERGQVVMMIPEGRDITELKRAQRERMSLTAQLHESQKIESLGRLAGGVAHDFNNLLTVIAGNLSLIQVSDTIASEQQQAIQETMDAARRAAELTRQLLTFSRRQIIEPRVFDPAECMHGLAKLLPRVVGEDIALAVNMTGNPAGLFMDPSQFEQIVMNLVVNARDAMPTGGRVDVTLECADIKAPRDLPQGLSAPGTYVILSVADTGTGIAEADLPRVFEPFFTTKAAGTGTGLGLATVHSIVTRALGCVGVVTSPGKGTTFRVYLPCCEQTPTVGRTSATIATVDERTGTILVVEDQATVRDLVVRSLKHFGFQVQAFADAATALSYARQPDHAFDLILTDVVMPGMGGRALADALRQLRPALPIVFMSGHTDDTVLRNGIEDALEYFLAKPFTPSKLVAKLRSVLEQSVERKESSGP